MYSYLLIFFIGITESLLILASIYFYRKKSKNLGGLSAEVVSSVIKKRRELRDELQSLITQCVPIEHIQSKKNELNELIEEVKVEKGRVTITYAELESLEVRLRELHEIERELKASSLETQEELNILQQKERELREKNQTIKDQLQASLSQLEELSSEIEINEELQNKMQKTKKELTDCQNTCNVLFSQIEEGNQLYVKMKRRYDALDIEYAQLYEKFSENQIDK
jgi:chromosome segregation ATPase